MSQPSQYSEQDFPTGTVTFLFTDIEASTHLLHQLGDDYADVLDQQRKLLRSAFGDNNGHEVDTQGDAFFYSFSRAKDAVSAAINAQKAIADHSWPEGVSLRVRMGLHTGEPVKTEEGYVGMDVHRSARICSAGHGGQILLSQATRVLVENDLPEGASLRDLGEHRLKDLQYPEHVFQLMAPGLAADFPPLKSLDTLPNNLPRQLTKFIGREREIEEVKNILADTYLLTLTGSGGCGKTRLGLQVAADLVEEYKDGVWVVELAPLSDPDLVIQEVASVLGIREESGALPMGVGTSGAPSATSEAASLLTRLTDYLQSKHLLLVLDNCEHLIEACIKLVDVLLRACPNLKIMVASREALGIAGESTYRVPSLSLPDPDNLPPVANFTKYESVNLFIDRAVAAVSTFRVTDQIAPAVAQICHRLDGIPLAIELAAARVRVLEVEEITTRLDDSFRLLTGGSRTALPRQQTLRAMIDWSYNLLSEGEGVLFNRLSVFMGGWTLEAAESICVGEEIDTYEVLDLLTGLVDKSLVIVERVSSGDGGGGKKRYHLLETVRQYGRDKLLESGEAVGLRDRHLEWYLGLAERAEPEFRGPDQVEWLDTLEAEHDNLRAALEWSMGKEYIEMGLRLAGTLWPFWSVRGYNGEGNQWLERVLSGKINEPASTLAMAARAKALCGSMWISGGNLTVKQSRLEESIKIWQELGDKSGIAESLYTLGVLMFSQGDLSRAKELLGESLSLYRVIGDKWGIATSLVWLAKGVGEFEGDYGRAGTLLKESLPLFREVGDRRGLAHVLIGLGDNMIHQGDYEEARGLIEEGLALSRELEDKWMMVSSLYVLGKVARGGGDYGRATEFFKESIVVWQEIDHGIKGLPVIRLEALGELAVEQGQLERGALLLGAAEALRLSVAFSPMGPDDRANYDRGVTAARSELGEEAFAAAWAEGQAMSMEEAIEYALQNEPELQ